MKLSIIIPVYNERSTIRNILSRVKSVNLIDVDKEIIVVDDFSEDGTRDILKDEEGVKVIYHKTNKGKGAAIKTGLNYVTGDIITIQDADLEYDPEDFKRLIKPILNGEASVVYGSRFIRKPESILLLYLIGNKLLTFITNMLFRSNLTDMETCYKMFKRGVIEDIVIKSDGFDFESEITAKILKKGIYIYEIPVSYSGRNSLQGKKIKFKDGISAIITLIKYRFFD
jgi:glycosyltransferase involved in cell wall biosynthesis